MWAVPGQTVPQSAGDAFALGFLRYEHWPRHSAPRGHLGQLTGCRALRIETIRVPKKAILFLPKMRVGEIQIIVPVRGQGLVLALMAIETDVMLEGMIERRKVGFADARLAK